MGVFQGVYVCIHRDRRGNAILASRRSEGKSVREREIERDIISSKALGKWSNENAVWTKKTLHLSLSIVLSLISPSMIIFQHLLITPPLLYFFMSSQCVSWLYPCMPSDKERWQKGRKRDGATTNVTCLILFPPLYMLSSALSMYPTEDSNLDSVNAKMTFCDWPSAVAEQGEKEKHEADRTASGPPITVSKMSV